MCYWHKKQNHYLCWIMSSAQDRSAFYCTADAQLHSFLTAVWRLQSLTLIPLNCTSNQIFRSWSTNSLLWSAQVVWISFVTLTPVIYESRPYLNCQHLPYAWATSVGSGIAMNQDRKSIYKTRASTWYSRDYILGLQTNSNSAFHLKSPVKLMQSSPQMMSHTLCQTLKVQYVYITAGKSLMSSKFLWTT